MPVKSIVERATAIGIAKQQDGVSLAIMDPPGKPASESVERFCAVAIQPIQQLLGIRAAVAMGGAIEDET